MKFENWNLGSHKISFFKFPLLKLTIKEWQNLKFRKSLYWEYAAFMWKSCEEMNQQTEKILELESCEIEHGIASHIPINIQHLPNFKLKVKLITTLSTMLFLQCLHSFPLKHQLLYCTLFILDYFLTKRMSNYIPLTCTLKFCMIS